MCTQYFFSTYFHRNTDSSFFNITFHTNWQTSLPSCSLENKKHKWNLPKDFHPFPYNPTTADSWRIEPEAWRRRRSVPPPLRPARSRTVAGSLCPTGSFSWGCWRQSPQREQLCSAGSRRRRRSGHLWSRPGTRRVWWHPRSSRNLQRGEGSINTSYAFSQI